MYDLPYYKEENYEVMRQFMKNQFSKYSNEVTLKRNKQMQSMYQ